MWFKAEGLMGTLSQLQHCRVWQVLHMVRSDRQNNTVGSYCGQVKRSLETESIPTKLLAGEFLVFQHRGAVFLSGEHCCFYYENTIFILN